MNLNDFEKLVDPKIAERGYEYFLDGLVDTPECFDDGVWHARIHGSDTYRVEIQTDPQDNQTIRDWQCDCPYDYGPVCKHVVAVLYAIAGQIQPNLKSYNSKKKPTLKDKISKIFKNTTEEDLQEFILRCINSIDGFEDRFWGHFANRLDDDPVLQYRNIIRNYARAAGDRHGFIDYRSAPVLTRPLWELNQKADELFDTGYTNESVSLCQILVEEVTEIIGQMDDSDGGAGDVIIQAFNTLESVAADASSEIKGELFDWCTQEFSREKYHDFGFESYLLDLLPKLVSSAGQEKQFFELLDRQMKHEKGKQWSDFGVTQLIRAKIDYLRTQNRDQEVLELLEAYNRFPDFRKQLVDRAIEEKDFETAKNLCQKGIEIAREQGHPGTTIQWQEKLFNIARMEDNVPEMRKWSETLLFKSLDSMQWYRALKATFTNKEWAGKCEEIINHIKSPNQGNGYVNSNLLAQIFTEENYTSRLLNLVRQNANDIYFVDQYVKVLQKEYATELPELYVQGILEVARQTGRKNYRLVVGWLRKMKKLTYGEEPAYALYTQMLDEYKNRPAMKEELERAFPAWSR